jgi:hypothetical protein
MALANAINPEHARTRSFNDVEIEGCTAASGCSPGALRIELTAAITVQA